MEELMDEIIALIKQSDEYKDYMIKQNEIIVAYYQSYYQLNDLLEEVTRIIFKDLIDTSLLQPYFQ